MLNIEGLILSNIDSIQIVDKNYRVVFNSRFEDALNITKEYNREDYINRNFFEIYPNIVRNQSSIVESMSTGEITIRRNQKFVDYKGRTFYTNNVTIPITVEGKIVGVFELTKDITTVENMEASSQSIISVAAQRPKGGKTTTFESILTENSYMLENIKRAKLLCSRQNPIFIYGETGTGKEVFAQAIINYCNVPPSKVIIQNCAAVPESLMESTLFGTVRGAYTGAENHRGLFEEADGGILFLDEFNSIPYSVQGKLLRVLQDGSFRPLGSNSEKTVQVKVITAMNTDPMEAIREKQMRSDLFYRLSGSMIKLLPLRERHEDIMFYTKYYIKQFNELYEKNIVGITEELNAFFMQYSWDGNVRELKNIIDSMVGICNTDILSTNHLPVYLYDILKEYQLEKNSANEDENSVLPIEPIKESDADCDNDSMNLNEILKKTEKELIEKALALSKGNKNEAASILGIPRQTLKYKIDKLQE